MRNGSRSTASRKATVIGHHHNAAFEVVAERSGSAPAGSTPDRQWPFVSDQDGVSLGVVALLFRLPGANKAVAWGQNGL